MRVLIVGCGYVGLPLGAELVRQGHEVFGLRRSAAEELKLAGITPLQADITLSETLANLPRDFDWVVNCAASGGGSADDYRQLYLQGTRNLIEWLASAPPKKFVYTSSTSVYGQNDGSLVKESSPTEPQAETAKVLVFGSETGSFETFTSLAATVGCKSWLCVGQTIEMIPHALFVWTQHRFKIDLGDLKICLDEMHAG